MAKNTFMTSELTKIHHVGVVVKDIDKAIKQLQSSGVIQLTSPSLPHWLEKRLFNGRTFDTEYRFFGKGPYLHPSINKVFQRGTGFFDPTLNPLAGGMLYRGKPMTGEYKIFKTKLGDKYLELFEAVKGESPWQEFLDSKGEGIHHIGFDVDELDRAIVKLLERGATMVLSGRAKNGDGGDYLDLGLGFLVEIFRGYH
jgi:hypothetical protein